MKKTILIASAAILCLGNINEPRAEDCPAGKIRGVSSGNCIDATGNCGENCTYTIDTNGLMTISGSGEMTDYDFVWDDNYEYPIYKDSQGNLPPGYKYGRDLKEVVFAPGSNITTIGQGFLDTSYITGITIPDSVRSIDANGLYTYSLESLVIPATVEYIGDDAIYGKNNMNIIMTDATDITEVSFSFGYGRNLTITCIGNQEGCDELVSKSGGGIKSYTLGDEDQCNASSKHYFTNNICNRVPDTTENCETTDYYYSNGTKCVKRGSPTSPITCSSGYTLSQNQCVVSCPNGASIGGECISRRYTPAEIAELVGESNTILLYYK